MASLGDVGRYVGRGRCRRRRDDELTCDPRLARARDEWADGLLDIGAAVSRGGELTIVESRDGCPGFPTRTAKSRPGDERGDRHRGGTGAEWLGAALRILPNSG
jgi:hypothetical protein